MAFSLRATCCFLICASASASFVCQRKDEISLIQDVMRVHKASPDSKAFVASLQTSLPVDSIISVNVLPSLQLPKVPLNFTAIIVTNIKCEPIPSLVFQAFGGLRPALEPIMNRIGVRWEATTSVLQEVLASIDCDHDLHTIVSDPQTWVKDLAKKTVLVVLTREFLAALEVKTEPFLTSLNLKWVDVEPIVQSQLGSIDSVEELESQIQTFKLDPVAWLAERIMDWMPVVIKSLLRTLEPLAAPTLWEEVEPVLERQLASIDSTEELTSQVHAFKADPGAWLAKNTAEWKPAIRRALLLNLESKAEPILARFYLQWGDVEPILDTQLRGIDSVEELKAIKSDPQVWLASFTTAWKPVVIESLLSGLQSTAEPILAKFKLKWESFAPVLEQHLSKFVEVLDLLPPVFSLLAQVSTMATASSIAEALKARLTSLSKAISMVTLANHTFEAGLAESLMPNAAMSAKHLDDASIRLPRTQRNSSMAS